jgi:hypothetical protein
MPPMVDVHLMQTISPDAPFHVYLGLSPMCFSCPIAGSHLQLSSVRTTVRVTRP